MNAPIQPATVAEPRRPKRSHALRNCLACFLLCCAEWVWYTGQQNIKEGFPPPWSNTLTLQWPGGIEVQAENDSNCAWDGCLYPYTITQNGTIIVEENDLKGDYPVKQGDSQGRPYFYVGPLIGIYRPLPRGGTPWLVWNTSHPSVENWLAEFIYKRTRVRKSRTEYFSDPVYGVDRLRVQGFYWTIVLRDTDWESNRDNDWSGGMPEYLHVESHDSGATWKVKERVTIPDWLDEIHPRWTHPKIPKKKVGINSHTHSNTSHKMRKRRR